MRFELFGLRVEVSTPAQRAKRRPEGVGCYTLRGVSTLEASEDFWSSFCGCGTIVAECGCGRVHFAESTTLDYAEGELEELLEKQKVHPDKYFASSEDAVSVIDMPDGLIVWGCPCHKATRYEHFLLDYRRSIMEFYGKLTRKAAAKLAQDKQELEAAN
jgi:hypothetical protein